jgi:hypothetical protein
MNRFVNLTLALLAVLALAVGDPVATGIAQTPSVPAITCATVFGVGESVPTVRTPKAVPVPGVSQANREGARTSLGRESGDTRMRRIAGSEPYVASPGPARKATEQNGVWRTVTCETWEGVDIPNWSSTDRNGTANGRYCWQTTRYQARIGLYSVWPAGGCTDGVSPTSHFYPNNADSWLEYGPFSLEDADDGYAVFSLWHQMATGASESDELFWGVSVDGFDYWGRFTTGRSTSFEPPTPDGWRDILFDFTNVPTLGSVIGEKEVWFAIVFQSDAAGVDDGPFIDDFFIEKHVVGLPTPTRTPGASPQPIATRTPTRTTTSTPVATATRVPPLVFPSISLAAGSAGPTLNWEPGTKQSSFALARISGQGTTLLPAGGTLPPTTTSYTDAGVPGGPVCYVLFTLAGAAQDPPTSSNIVCLLAQTRTASGAPQDFGVRLAQPRQTLLTWQSPPGGGHDGYILAPFGRPPIALGPDATSAVDSIGAATCYVLFAQRAGQLVGNTDILCAIPPA